jgi:hypothetical protein
LIDLVRSKLLSIGYKLSEDLTAFDAIPGVFISRSEVPLPVVSQRRLLAANFAFQWVSEQLRHRVETENATELLDEFFIEFPLPSPASKWDPLSTVNTMCCRFAQLEPVANWITFNSSLDATFQTNGLQVKRKTDRVLLETAALRSNALLFSTVVFPRNSALEGPDWSRLPRIAIRIIQRFLVGDLNRVHVIRVAGAGLAAVNGIYHGTQRMFGAKLFVRVPDTVSNEAFVIQRVKAKYEDVSLELFPVWTIKNSQNRTLYQTIRCFQWMPENLEWNTSSEGTRPSPISSLVSI